jgi:SH3 domain protein
VAALLPAAAAAEPQWVWGESTFELRTGPGIQYRIVAYVKKDERVDVLTRESGWAQVRNAAEERGWLLERYLQREPPPSVQLERARAELATARAELDSLGREAAELREESARLTERDAQQGEQILRLTEENLDLKAGERWPYLITGASILVAGMLGGALVTRLSARRPQPRIRF